MRSSIWSVRSSRRAFTSRVISLPTRRPKIMTAPTKSSPKIVVPSHPPVGDGTIKTSVHESSRIFRPSVRLPSSRFPRGIVKGWPPLTGVAGVSPASFSHFLRRLRQRAKEEKGVVRGHPYYLPPRQGARQKAPPSALSFVELLFQKFGMTHV